MTPLTSVRELRRFLADLVEHMGLTSPLDADEMARRIGESLGRPSSCAGSRSPSPTRRGWRSG